MADDTWGSTHLSIVLRVSNPKDSVAWTRFVEQYRSPIVQYCRQRFRLQDSAAEDVAQGILCKLIQGMQRFNYNPQKSLRGWLKTVTRNAVYDHLEKEGKRLDVGTGKTEVRGVIANQPADEDAEALTDTLTDDLRRDLLQEAEAIVSKRMRNEQNWQAYLLLKEGKSAKEVGAQLGMSVAAVYKAKSRVLQFMREAVSELLKSKGLDDDEGACAQLI